MSKFFEVEINACSGGFGEYEIGEIGSGDAYEDADSILWEISGQGIEAFELGVDDLPPEAENICGRIHNQQGRIFCHLVNGDGEQEPRYFAIVEVAETVKESLPEPKFSAGNM